MLSSSTTQSPIAAAHSVMQAPLQQVKVPTLLVHHKQDGCSLCAFSETPALMAKLTNAARSQLLSFDGGKNEGDPCEAFAYHGFNGLESEVVRQTAAWVLAR